jgi:protein required for attachment to host cells
MIMERVRIPWKSWVVVCDGVKALTLRNDGDAELLNLTLVDVRFKPEPPTRELGSDRPGRAFQSQGFNRSAEDQTDLHAQGEASFLSEVAERLDKAVREHSIKSVVLVAPPKALGILRKRLTPAALAVVTAEVAKDLARLSTPEIEKHLAG